MGLHRIGHERSDSAAVAAAAQKEKKGCEGKLDEIMVENFPSMEKETVNQVQEAQSVTQDKPKEKHTKTHTDQMNKE